MCKCSTCTRPPQLGSAAPLCLIDHQKPYNAAPASRPPLVAASPMQVLCLRSCALDRPPHQRHRLLITAARCTLVVTPTVDRRHSLRSRAQGSNRGEGSCMAIYPWQVAFRLDIVVSLAADSQWHRTECRYHRHGQPGAAAHSGRHHEQGAAHCLRSACACVQSHLVPLWPQAMG